MVVKCNGFKLKSGQWPSYKSGENTDIQILFYFEINQQNKRKQGQQGPQKLSSLKSLKIHPKTRKFTM